MKKIIFLTIILVLTVSSLTSAANFELDGGFLYTTFDSDTLNDIISSRNEWYKTIAGLNPNPDIDNFGGVIESFSMMNDLDSATGFYVGFKSDYLKDKKNLDYKIGMTYEEFSNDVNSNLHVIYDNFESRYYTSIDIEVKGITVNGEREVNDYFTITGSLGYYYGKLKHLTKSSILGIPSNQNKSINEISYDLDGGIGFKFGISTDLSISENLDLTGKANYRILELDSEKLYESIDFNGWDLKAGLSYKF